MNYSNEPLRYHLGFANSYQKYKLQFKQDFEFGPVRVIAFPEDGEDIENIFSHSGDAELNLSPYIGIDSSGKLFWDTNGHQPVDSLKVISVEPLGLEGQPHSKFIRISYKVESVVHRHDLNLDDFLDVVECYDETSRQFRLRLGVKPTRTKRSIVLCFDGTSNHFGNQNTNVIKLVELLKKNDPSKQMVYYQAGIGTYSHSGLKTRIGSAIAKCFDTATAHFLHEHVIDGYRYLMQTYQAGDKISIFGFSRGAYTARALAGMLHSVGLLPKDNMEQVQFAYEVYEASERFISDRTHKGDQYLIGAVNLKNNLRSFNQNASPGDVDPECFKMVFCTPVEISFLGVWDTVGSMGILRRKILPWIVYNPSVKIFRQALALDEVRANFTPTLWNHSKTQTRQSAVEVWFKGGHSDVGGGAPLAENERVGWLVKLNRSQTRRIFEGFLTPFRQLGLVKAESPQLKYVKPSLPNQDPDTQQRQSDLSNISLRWMVDQCLSLSDAHVLFDPYVMHCYRQAKILEERPPGAGPEEIQKNRIALDNYDIAVTPYVASNKIPWWILPEVLPIPRLSQSTSHLSESQTVFCPNTGSGRIVSRPEAGARVRLHYSVCKNMNSPPYRPRALWQGPTIQLDVEDSPYDDTDSGTKAIRDFVKEKWEKTRILRKILKLPQTHGRLGWLAVHALVAAYLWLYWKYLRFLLSFYQQYLWNGCKLVFFKPSTRLVNYLWQKAATVGKPAVKFCIHALGIKGW